MNFALCFLFSLLKHWRLPCHLLAMKSQNHLMYVLLPTFCQKQQSTLNLHGLVGIKYHLLLFPTQVRGVMFSASSLVFDYNTFSTLDYSGCDVKPLSVIIYLILVVLHWCDNEPRLLEYQEKPIIAFGLLNAQHWFVWYCLVQDSVLSSFGPRFFYKSHHLSILWKWCLLYSLQIKLMLRKLNIEQISRHLEFHSCLSCDEKIALSKEYMKQHGDGLVYGQ